jgi:hypothetical protein
MLMSILVLNACCHMGKYEVASDFGESGKTRNHIRQMGIPEVDLQEVSIVDAISFLVESGGRNNEVGMSIVYMDPTEQDSKISIRKQDVSFFDVLEEICRQSGMRWKIDGKVVIINPEMEEVSLDSDLNLNESAFNDPFDL